MNGFKAKRLSLSQLNIYNQDDQPLCFISWPKVRIWSCENSVIGDPYSEDKSPGSYPSLTIMGMKFVARRKLLTNKFFGNEYEFSLWDENGQSKISAHRPGWIWKKTEIKFNGQTYFLTRKNLFNFCFALYYSYQIGQFTNVTPFFAFSSNREFSLSCEGPVDPVLLSFGFFLAHNEFF